MGKKKKRIFEFKELSRLKEIKKYDYTEGNFKTRISLAKTDKGIEGIKIRTASIKPPREHRPGIWIPKNINLKKWFSWLKERLDDIIVKIWKKERSLEDELKEKEIEILNLEEEIKQLQKELEKAKLEKEILNKEIELAKSVVERLDEFREDLNNFKKLVEEIAMGNNRKETEIKKFLKNHKWILGLDCEIKAIEKEVDPSLRIDMHIVTNYGEHRIFEIKSPNVSVFKKDLSTISTDFSRGLHQLIMYIHKTDIYSWLDKVELPGIQAPIGTLLIGYNLSKKEKELLNEWNRHLRPHIRVLTYNDIIEGAERILSNIEAIKETNKE